MKDVDLDIIYHTETLNLCWDGVDFTDLYYLALGL